MIVRQSRILFHLARAVIFVLLSGRRAWLVRRRRTASQPPGVLEPAVVLQVNRDTGCPPGVTSRRSRSGRSDPIVYAASVANSQRPLPAENNNLVAWSIEPGSVAPGPPVHELNAVNGHSLRFVGGRIKTGQ